MKSKLCLILLGLAILFISGTGFTQDFFSDDNIPNKKTVQVIAEHIYYVKNNLFSIGRFSDDLRYTEIGSVDLGSRIFGIKVFGDWAYAALGRSGLCVINIRTKTAPVVVKRMPSTRAYDVDVIYGKDEKRQFAFIAGGPENLRIYDIRNPAEPEWEGVLLQGVDIYKIFVLDRFAYASSPEGGIQIIDVFNPIDPRLVGTIDTGSKASIISVDGDYAFVAEHEQGLNIYNVGIPSEPAKISDIQFEGDAVDVYVLGGRAIVTDGGNGLYVVDIRDAANPKVINTYPTGAQGGGIFVRHKFAYIADGENPVSVVHMNKAVETVEDVKPVEEQPETTVEKTKTETTKPPEKVTPPEKVEEPPPEPATIEAIKSSFREVQRWAVIIGVSDYLYAEVPDLSYADADALMFYNFIISPEGGAFKQKNTALLLNENAKTQDIKDYLNVFLKKAGKDDLVYIYFSGHGAPEPSNPDNMYLITHDTDLYRLESTAFPMWHIQDALERFIKSDRVIIITDACHSGGVGVEIEKNNVEEQNLVNRHFMELSKSRAGRISLTASESGELSQESTRWGGGHGVFTYFLVEGLKGAADINADGLVTLGELIQYSSSNVTKETASAQHPDTAGKIDPFFPMAIVNNKK